LHDELTTVDAYIDEYLETDMDTGVVADVFDSVRSPRGKMIRPCLLLLSARFGPDYTSSRDRLCRLGALVEIIHMASLIHDDIIDNSPLRRGRSTVQARFGKDMAVYAGDFMLSRAMYYLSKENMLKAGAIMARTIEDMCRGELGQMVCRWDTETTLDAYLKNVYGKTVALFVTAARLGAGESGCADREIGYLGGIGEDLGYMFQMRDDLLDFVSDEKKEGKPVHKDFSDGIYTMPVLYAFGNADCGDRLREIAALSSDTPGYAEYIFEMSELIRVSGGLEFTGTQIESHAVQALRQLTTLPRRSATSVIKRLIRMLTSNYGMPISPAKQPL